MAFTLQFKAMLIALLMFLAMTPLVDATHGRFANYNWRRDSVASNTVTIEIQQGWRTGYYVWRGVGVGQTISHPEFAVNWGDGSKSIQTLTVEFSSNTNPSLYNTDEDYFIGSLEDTHTYDYRGSFYAYTHSCCRILSLVDGNRSRNYKYILNINLDSNVLGSPRTTGIPIVTVFKNQENIYRIPVSNPGGPYTLTFSSYSKSALYYNVPTPNNMYIDDDKLVWTPTGTEGLYAVQVTVEDDASGIWAIVDFLLLLTTDVTTPSEPSFNPAVTEYTLFVGEANSLQVSASSPVGLGVKITNNVLPSGTTITDCLEGINADGTSIGDTCTVQVDYTPDLADYGDVTIILTARDSDDVFGPSAQLLTHIVATEITEVLGATSASTLGGGSITITGIRFGQPENFIGCTIDGVALTNCVHDGDTNEVTGTVPAGTGADNALVCTWSHPDRGLSSSNSLQFPYDYAEPTISGVTPITGGTEGGYEISITGTNFGASGQAVYIDGVPSTNCVVNGGHTEIVCLVPAGSGDNLDISVDVGGQTATAPQTFSYTPPTIATVSTQSNTYPCAGGITLTLTGENFGGNSESPTVTVDGRNCPVVGTPTHDVIRCTLPARGNDLDFLVDAIVTVGGQSSTPDSNSKLTYDAPIIDSILDGSCVTGGGCRITILGSNFGLSGADCYLEATDVSFNEEADVIVVSDSLMVIDVPAGPSGTVDLVIAQGPNGLANNGQETRAASGFLYTAPSISLVSGQGGPTEGGQDVTITGESFGLGDGTGSVTIAGQPCPFVSWSHTQIVCTAPAGEGLDQSLVVTVRQGGSDSDNYGYGRPVISSVTPSVGATDGGIISIHGSSFGPGQDTVTITRKDCAVLSWNDTDITCTAQTHSRPPEWASGAYVVVTVENDSQKSTGFNVLFEAPLGSSVCNQGVCVNFIHHPPCPDSE